MKKKKRRKMRRGHSVKMDINGRRRKRRRKPEIERKHGKLKEQAIKNELIVFALPIFFQEVYFSGK